MPKCHCLTWFHFHCHVHITATFTSTTTCTFTTSSTFTTICLPLLCPCTSAFSPFTYQPCPCARVPTLQILTTLINGLGVSFRRIRLNSTCYLGQRSFTNAVKWKLGQGLRWLVSNVSIWWNETSSWDYLFVSRKLNLGNWKADCQIWVFWWRLRHYLFQVVRETSFRMWRNCIWLDGNN